MRGLGFLVVGRHRLGPASFQRDAEDRGGEVGSEENHCIAASAPAASAGAVMGSRPLVAPSECVPVDLPVISGSIPGARDGTSPQSGHQSPGSAAWFGAHRVLREGCVATRGRLLKTPGGASILRVGKTRSRASKPVLRTGEPMASVHIACPAPRGSRQGNRVTAERWAGLLRRSGHTVALARTWRGEPCDVLVALHATKSAASISRFRRAGPARPLVVVLTGTDLYRDIAVRPTARRSLELASRLVVLQPLALRELSGPLRAKTRVIYQSAQLPGAHSAPRRRSFEVCVVGHLRPIKDPWRAALAARMLPATSRIRLLHAGAALTQAMARRARAEERRNPRYTWLGDLPHGRLLRLLARSRLLVLSSRMEGGANVLSESVVVGTPILASRIPGSVGLLGEDYPGFFPPDDARALVSLLRRAEEEPAFLQGLAARCALLAPLFEPERERAALEVLLDEL